MKNNAFFANYYLCLKLEEKHFIVQEFVKIYTKKK